MTDRPDKSTPAQEPARTSSTESDDRKAEGTPTDPRSDGDTQQPVTSRPRGKTEDPDRTL
jgi:hypothetical protein